MGGVIIGVLAVTAASILLGQSTFSGIVATPPSIAPVFLQMDIPGALQVGLVTVVFAFLFVDLFDNTGTLIGLAHRGGFMRADGTVPRLRGALISDSAAAMVGAALGTSTTTSYIESASGINAGGRTGLTALTVAALFVLASLFRATRRIGAALGDGAGAALCRLPDDAQPDRDRMERCHRGCARDRHGARDAFYFLNCRGHCLRIHHLCRGQTACRACQRHSSGRCNSLHLVRHQIRGHRVNPAATMEICLSSNDYRKE